MNRIDKLKEELELDPHPEGGWFRETYRCRKEVETSRGIKNAGTGIYFLLAGGELSQWHRVASDEMWHFYEGDTLILEMIHPGGSTSQKRLGTSLALDEEPQVLVPGGSWQRAWSSGGYTLVGCTVTPGFDFNDFEMMEPERLTEEYPDLKEFILRDPFG